MNAPCSRTSSFGVLTRCHITLQSQDDRRVQSTSSSALKGSRVPLSKALPSPHLQCIRRAQRVRQTDVYQLFSGSLVAGCAPRGIFRGHTSGGCAVEWSSAGRERDRIAGHRQGQHRLGNCAVPRQLQAVCAAAGPAAVSSLTGGAPLPGPPPIALPAKPYRLGCSSCAFCACALPEFSRHHMPATMVNALPRSMQSALGNVAAVCHYRKAWQGGAAHRKTQRYPRCSCMSSRRTAQEHHTQHCQSSWHQDRRPSTIVAKRDQGKNEQMEWNGCA